MSEVGAVIPQNAALPSTLAADRPDAGMNLEQRLLDYIASHQAEGLAKAQHLGNPAALGGEALKSLKGYFERATALQDRWAKKAHAMSENEMVGQSAGGLQLASLPGGPASERMEGATKAGVGGKAGVTEAELDRTVDALMQVMHYSVETTMITSATHNVGRSVLSLIHGQ